MFSFNVIVTVHTKLGQIFRPVGWKYVGIYITIIPLHMQVWIFPKCSTELLNSFPIA